MLAIPWETKHNDKSAPIFLESSAAEVERESESEIDTDAVLEQQLKHSEDNPSKLGGLLANMHVCVVKKLKSSGPLLHNTTGSFFV